MIKIRDAQIQYYNVSPGTLSAGQALIWDGSNWVNSGNKTDYLTDIGDVVVSSAINGNFLIWDGSNWVNSGNKTDYITSGILTSTLTNYLTSAEINTDFVTSDELTTNYLTSAEINTDYVQSSTLVNYLTSTEINTDFVTSGGLTSSLTNYLTSAEIAIDYVQSSTLVNYLTSTEINTDFVTSNELTTNYLTSTEIITDFVTSSELTTNYLTSTEIITNFITSGEINSNFIDSGELNTELTNYVTSGELTTNYLTSAEIAIDYIQSSAYAGFITSSELSTALTDYLTSGVITTDYATSSDISSFLPITISGTATINQVVKYNGSKWINSVDTGPTSTALNGLTDVVISSPVENQLLVFDTSSDSWVNRSVSVVGEVYTASEDTNFTSESVKNFDVGPLYYNSFNIVQGKIYATTPVPFSQNVIASYYSTSARKAGDLIYRTSADLAVVALSSSATSGTISAVVVDGSDFFEGDLVYFLSGSTEFNRITTVSGNNLTFEDTLTYNHDSGDPLTKVGELDMFAYHDATNLSKIYGKYEFDSVQSTDIKFDLLYGLQGIATTSSDMPPQLFKTIMVSKLGSDVTGNGGIHAPFLTIKAALGSITDASETNPHKIMIDPGIYEEELLLVPEYVFISGSTIYSTIIEPDADDHHVMIMEGNSEISFLTFQNVGSGYAGVVADNVVNYVQLHKVGFIDCDIGIKYENTTVTNQLFLEYVECEGTFTKFMSVKGTGIYYAVAALQDCFFTNDDSATSIIDLDSKGVLTIADSGFNGNGSDKGINVIDGTLTIQSSYFRSNDTGVYVGSGTNTSVIMNSLIFHDCTTNFNITGTTTTGYYTGYIEYVKKSINNSNSFFITNRDANIITVAKKGGDFSSIKSAIESVTDASSSNPYIISVGSGMFSEDPFTMKAFVGILGQHYRGSIITSNNSTGTFITGVQDSGIVNVKIEGPTGTSGISLLLGGTSGGIAFLLSNCLFGDGKIHIYMGEITSQTNGLNMDNTIFSGTQDTCIYANSTSASNPIMINMSEIESVETCDVNNDFIQVNGYVDIHMISCRLLCAASSTANTIRISNGVELNISATTIRDFNKGLVVDNTGSAPSIKINVIFNCITKDIEVNHTTTTGSVFGSAVRSKVTNLATNTLQLTYQDPVTGDFNNTRILATRGFSTDLTTITSASQTTTMLSTDAYCYVVTGSTTGQIIKLPDATTLRVGHEFWVNNSSTVQITVQDFGASDSFVLNPGSSANVKLRDNSTTSGVWIRQISIANTLSSMYAVSCSYSSNAGTGRYLEFWPSNPSDSSPFKIITTTVLVGLAINSTSSTTGTVSIFKNSNFTTAIATISLTSQTSNYLSNLSILLDSGDTLSVQVTSGSLSKPGCSLYLVSY